MAQRNGFEDCDDEIDFAFNHEEINFEHSQNLNVPTYDDDEVNTVYEELVRENFQETHHGEKQIVFSDENTVEQEFPQNEDLEDRFGIGRNVQPLESDKDNRVDQLYNQHETGPMFFSPLTHPMDALSNFKLHQGHEMDSGEALPQKLHGMKRSMIHPYHQMDQQSKYSATKQAKPKMMFPVRSRQAYTQKEMEFLNQATRQNQKLRLHIQRTGTLYSSPLNRTVVASPNWENQPENHQAHQQRATHPPNRKAEKLTRWGRKSQEDKDRLNRKRTENRREQRKRDIQKAREERENQVNGTGSSDKKKELLQKINFLNSLL